MKYRVYIAGNNLREELQDYCNLLNEWRYIHTPEARANRAKTMMEKYGTLMYVDKDARKRCYETNKQNKTGICSRESYKKEIK